MNTGKIVSVVASGNVITSFKAVGKPQDSKVSVETTPSGNKFVNWGSANDLPNQIYEWVEKNEVLHRAAEFNTGIHFGGGLSYHQEILDGKRRVINQIMDPEIEDWLEENNPSDFMWKQLCHAYEVLGNPFTEMATNTSRNYIARLFVKKSAWCRWEKQDPTSKEVMNLMVSADWSRGDNSDIVTIPALNSQFPVQDLLSRSSGSNFAFRIPPVAANRYYYEPSNAEVLINSGTLEISGDIRRTIRAMLKNQATMVWHVEVFEEYFVAKLGQTQWNKKKDNPAEIKKLMEALQTEMTSHLSGSDNAGKALVTGSMYDKSGKERPGIKITALKSNIEKGAWIPDQQQMSEFIYTGMGVDPSAVGGFSNQNRTMNSGSEKESSFWNSQAVLAVERAITFMPLYFVARVNGWTRRYPGFRWGVKEMSPSILSTDSQSSNPTAKPQQ